MANISDKTKMEFCDCEGEDDSMRDSQEAGNFQETMFKRSKRQFPYHWKCIKCKENWDTTKRRQER